MKTQIIILYPYENDTSVPALAGLYHEILQRQGYAVSSFCTSDYPSSAELFDAITSEASPDFGISLNLAGLNFLNTGEDSILKKFELVASTSNCEISSKMEDLWLFLRTQKM